VSGVDSETMRAIDAAIRGGRYRNRSHFVCQAIRAAILTGCGK
jgi:Arc/MetJ-type ribon-helix-helix transcriptional regulator